MRLRRERGFEAAHVDADEVVGDVSHEPANETMRSEL
jgi:hypothetical protein